MNLRITYEAFLKMWIIRWGDEKFPSVRFTQHDHQVPKIVAEIIGLEVFSYPGDCTSADCTDDLPQTGYMIQGVENWNPAPNKTSIMKEHRDAKGIPYENIKVPTINAADFKGCAK